MVVNILQHIQNFRQRQKTLFIQENMLHVYTLCSIFTNSTQLYTNIQTLHCNEFCVLKKYIIHYYNMTRKENTSEHFSISWTWITWAPSQWPECHPDIFLTMNKCNGSRHPELKWAHSLLSLSQQPNCFKLLSFCNNDFWLFIGVFSVLYSP